jgi:hypothetical protein
MIPPMAAFPRPFMRNNIRDAMAAGTVTVNSRNAKSGLHAKTGFSRVSFR